MIAVVTKMMIFMCTVECTNIKVRPMLKHMNYIETTVRFTRQNYHIFYPNTIITKDYLKYTATPFTASKTCINPRVDARKADYRRLVAQTTMSFLTSHGKTDDGLTRFGREGVDRPNARSARRAS